MKQLTIRLDEPSVEMLGELSTKITATAQTIINMFTYLRRGTITELKGRFKATEIRALAEAYKNFKPSWQIMSSSLAIIETIIAAEKYKAVISTQGCYVDDLIAKVKPLTSAQALILQLELISFWNHPTPEIKTLVKALS